jgi:hypothetical protein
MRMMNGTLVSVAAGLALVLAVLPSVSRAAIVETIVDTVTDATLGSITFPTFTGNSDAGVLFSFDGDFTEFTQANITSISWTLDPATAAVVALDLNALVGDNPCPNGGNCSNTTVSLSPTFATEAELSATMDSAESARAQANIRFAPVLAPVPEPSTWAMMLVGFAGLGLVGYRASRKTAVTA